MNDAYPQLKALGERNHHMASKATSDVLERFVRYCEVPSQSDPRTATAVPSTPAQVDMARVVASDLRDLGAKNVTLDEHAYVTAHWPASAGAEKCPTLAFCCHLDTAWQDRKSVV